MNNLPEQKTLFFSDLSTTALQTVNTGFLLYPHRSVIIKNISYSHIANTALDTSIFQVNWSRTNQPLCVFATSVTTFVGGVPTISSNATFCGHDLNTIHAHSDLNNDNIDFSVVAKGWGTLEGALSITLEFV